MRAVAVFPDERQIRLVDHPEPGIVSSSQLKVRVLEVGLCGTDREIASFRYGTPPEDSPYLVIGHESLAEVVETGSSVHRIHPGDLVVPTVRRPCRRPECRACRMGRPDFCQSGEFVQRGIRGAHGYMADLVVDDVRYMNPVSRELRDVAVLAQPLSVAEQALAQLEDVQRRLPWAQLASDTGSGRDGDRRAVVLGSGPVGILGGLALQIRGYRTTVFSAEARGRKSEIAESLGLAYASGKETTFAELARRLGGVDVIYEATGAGALAFEAMRSLGPNGVFIFTGIPGRRTPVHGELADIMPGVIMKNQVVFGTVNPGAEAYRAAVQDLAVFARRWPMALPSLVSGRYPLAEAAGVLARKGQGIKEVMVLAEPRS